MVQFQRSLIVIVKIDRPLSFRPQKRVGTLHQAGGMSSFRRSG